MTNRWLLQNGHNPHTKLRLFCLPYAGGGGTIFYQWSQHLPPDVAVYPLVLPGRETRILEPPYTRMAPLVEAITAVLHPYLDGTPFAIFGHSMGALVGFELARQLRRHYDLTPAHLFLSAHRAPHLPNPDPPLHTLPDEAFLEQLIHLGGAAAETLDQVELLKLMLPTIRADFAVCETYIWQEEAPFDCPITLFAGLNDEVMTAAEMEDWSRETSGPCRLRILPGNHFFLQSAQTLLLAQITHDLQKILQPAAPAETALMGERR